MNPKYMITPYIIVLLVERIISHKIYINSALDHDYQLTMIDGHLRVVLSTEKLHAFETKKGKKGQIFLPEIKTPDNIYDYLIHVLEGKCWKLVGDDKAGFKIMNGMYCLTVVSEIYGKCNVNFPIEILQCDRMNIKQNFEIGSCEEGNKTPETGIAISVGFEGVDNVKNSIFGGSKKKKEDACKEYKRKRCSNRKGKLKQFPNLCFNSDDDFESSDSEEECVKRQPRCHIDDLDVCSHQCDNNNK